MAFDIPITHTAVALALASALNYENVLINSVDAFKYQ